MNIQRFDGVPYYSFRLFEPWPELSQAVFTRDGGVSDAPYDSLNVSFAVRDDPERVRSNRERVALAVGFDAADLVSARQVHGRHVVAVTRADRGTSELAECDALVTDEPGVLLLLKYADCVPVALWDPVRRVVALVHAGWRGTVLGAPGAAVEFMVQRYGSRPSNLLAGIGPSIGPCCYEIGHEVASAAGRAFPGASVLQPGAGGRVHLDLWGANAETLMRAGVPEENVELAGLCTRCRSDLFFSHRASGGLTGRFGMVAGIRNG